MNYKETLDFLYSQLPVFENVGAHAYKPGLERMTEMDEILGHPHTRSKTIHVAGTNGKGTCSHTLASILQEAGMKVGLFTSPHLLDFNERIRVNGDPCEHDFVVEWTAENYDKIKHLQPSFFELATMMGFCYFAQKGVDIAVIEVGLGGRLDSTNIISPVLSVITNISFDHTQFLGTTLPQIAAEKAGIMKAGTPCVIGECDDDAVRGVYEQNAERRGVSKLTFASDYPQIIWVRQIFGNDMHNEYETINNGMIESPLMGACQPKNANTILAAVHQLNLNGFSIPDDVLQRGFRNVIDNTHLMGRWQVVTADKLPVGQSNQNPVILDTGHNEGCFQYIGKQLKQIVEKEGRLNIVFGMVRDKDISAVLKLLPTDARYFFCNAPTSRALPAAELQSMSAEYGLKGDVYPSVLDAYHAARNDGGTTFVGGSNFIVCEVLGEIL